MLNVVNELKANSNKNSHRRQKLTMTPSCGQPYDVNPSDSQTLTDFMSITAQT